MPFPQRGELVGRYMVLEEIGRGAMGVVYSAYDPELDRKVALKLVLDDDPEAGGRIQREARALARANHPNVLTIHDVGGDDGRAFIAMELVTGASLAAWNEARHSWREVVELFVAAGRGLAAAHTAGLVHRDFKPSNVLLTHDERVLVTDFGLARPLEHDVVAPAGTPAYMAPEQMVPGPVDARADQYAFCVALFESLWGRRPHAAASLPEASARAAHGAPRPPPRPRTPRWLRRVVVRGLAPDPAQRFTTMDELLGAIASGQRGATRARVAAGVGIAGLVAIGAVWIAGDGDRCAGVSTMAGVWDPERATALEQSFVATTVPYAGDAAARVRLGLDARSAALATGLRDACRAGGTDAAHHRKMACLAENREQLRALVDVLVEADDGVVEQSFAAIERLHDPTECSATAALESADPAEQMPADERATLRRIEALHEIGKYREALALTVELAGRTESPVVRCRALFQRGAAEQRLGDFAAAEQSLFDAFVAAQAGGDHEFAIHAATWLTVVVGADLGRTDEGLRWGRVAEALVEGTGAQPRFARAITGDLVQVYQRKDDFDAALAYAARAVDLAEADEPRDAIAYGVALMNLGSVHGMRAEYDDARAQLERAVEILSAHLPAAHTDLAVARSNLAQAWTFLGESAAAAELYVELLRDQKAAYGVDHIDVARIELAYATTLRSLGRREEAQALFEHALAVFERVHGPTHQMVAITLLQLGEGALDGNESAQALRWAERAATVVAHHPESHDMVGRIHFMLARALHQTGAAASRRDEAIATARREFAADPRLAENTAALEEWVRSLR